MDLHLDLYQLRTFHAVALTGSFAEAARRLNLTTSAISHAVRKLEATACTPLVLRQGGRIELSAEGEELARTCAVVFQALDEAETRLGRGKSMPWGRLKVGSTVEFGCSVLMEEIQPFVQAHPELEMEFFFDANLLEPLLHEDIDVAIDCCRHARPEIIRTPLFSEPYVVLCHPRIRDEASLETPADLARATLLSSDRAGTWWNRFLDILPEQQRPGRLRFTALNQIRAMITAASHAMGVALVPEYCVKPELASGSLVRLFPGYPPVGDQFYLYEKRSLANRPRNRSFVLFLRSLKPALLT